MPIDYKRYPPMWKAISLEIRSVRAGGRCEWCGARNKGWVYRLEDGTPVEVCPIRVKKVNRCAGFVEREGGDNLFGARNVTRIILTVAHLGVPFPSGRPGDKTKKHDIRPENLAALCQRCHLRFDVDEHKANRRKTRAERAAAELAARLDPGRAANRGTDNEDQLPTPVAEPD